jgi:cyclopropane-fatty-acyl-phospholipid synthase
MHMLDKRMTYSCGYWKNAQTLDEAQEQKLDLTCRKLSLQPEMSVLDIGCGWGSFAKYAAEKYDALVTGITVSKDQTKYVETHASNLPVQIQMIDYRDLHGQFDRIASIGMFEHVGFKNYRKFMKVAHDCLKDSGIFLLHTIGGNTSETTIDPWIQKYIFPGAMLPSIKQIGKAIEGLFVMEDWHNFSADYDKTLMAWHDNFVRNWDKIKDHYSDEFFRLWSYYLLMCAGTFRARKNQLWQIVLSKNGIPGGYVSVR